MQPTYEGKIQLAGVDLFVRTFGSSGDELIFMHGGPGWDLMEFNFKNFNSSWRE